MIHRVGSLVLGRAYICTDVALVFFKKNSQLLNIAQTNLATVLNSKDSYTCIGSLNRETGASHAQYIFFEMFKGVQM